MVSTRSFLLAACALPLSLVACGGSSEDSPVVPEGTHYGYVVSKAFVPASNKQATDYGLDLGAAKSGTPDGIVDNKLGVALAALAGYNFNVQGTVDTAIAKGSIILLVDFQTKDFQNSSAAGLSVKLGANPVPAACSSPTDTTCGHHLVGGAMFSIAADSPPDALVSGKIVNGTFNGGPGDIALQIALGSTEPITLSLLNARAKATAITDAGMTATVGGALSLTDLNMNVLPAIQGQVKSILDADCGPVAMRMAPGCSCKTASSGTILGLFDGDIAGTVKDCTISLEEIQGSALIKSLLGPDVCSTKSCTAPDALSIGIQVQTVKAILP
jgi:hypothetical protein